MVVRQDRNRNKNKTGSRLVQRSRELPFIDPIRFEALISILDTVDALSAAAELVPTVDPRHAVAGECAHSPKVRHGVRACVLTMTSSEIVRICASNMIQRGCRANRDFS
jgi:hypothetical protein